MNQYVKQYQKLNIETASREQILIMLYDAAIQFLNKAKVAMRNKEIEASNNNIIAAENIIQEFINSMDRDASPQLAENLIALYNYFLRRLVYANIKHKVEPIDEVLKYLKSLKATWEKAIEIYKKEMAQDEMPTSSADYYDDFDDGQKNEDEEDDENEEEEDEEE